jgi:23S rRNA (pseudouridine1915-N3)-methyltransferase
MRVVAIGKAGKTAPESALFARYAARMKPALILLELPDGKGAPAEIKRREAAVLLAALAAGDFVVALDAGGVAPDSLQLADMLARWLESGRRLNFLIGGAEGLDAAVIARADAVLSLGRPTWPHLLARAMLAEQLYRAQMILAGHPYHRAGRP